MPTLKPIHPPRPHVVIAGAGVGALEAALALRAHAGDMVSIDLVAPDDDFTYRAMAVAEPFGYAPPLRIPIARLTEAHAIHHRVDVLTRVDVAAGAVELGSGARLDYDALICALGARARPWLPGAVTFGGRTAVDAVREVLARLESGDAESVVFAAPPGLSWTLPLYELALLTATWCVDRGLTGVSLAVVTSEEEPLAVFGPAAARAVRDLLADRGVRLVRDRQVESAGDGVVRLAGGARLDADAVITLPQLSGNPIDGLPADEDGFIPTGSHGEVKGAAGVHVVGDGTTFPVKQGGIAAQQADAAAAAIAHGFGAAVEVERFTPVVRGLLLTGVTSAYLRSSPESGASAVAFDALWWPPTKVAGRYLGPVLADLHAVGAPAEMTERPIPADAAGAASDRAELRRMALDMAESDAEWGDFRSALRWLQTIEYLDGVLPADLAAKRAAWQAGLQPAHH